MIITEKILQDLSNKYQLEYNQFKFVTKKNFFKNILLFIRVKNISFKLIKIKKI